MSKSKTIWPFLLLCLAVPPSLAKTPAKVLSPEQQRGKGLIETYQCTACHIINGHGPNNGVNLDKLNRTPKFVVDQLLDPEEHVAKNPKAFNFDPNLMPSHQLTKAEAQAIAVYLLRNKPSKITKKTPKPTRSTQAK